MKKTVVPKFLYVSTIILIVLGISAVFLWPRISSWVLSKIDPESMQANSSLSVNADTGRQIIFGIKNNQYFTYLKIQGMNQKGQWTTWVSPLSYKRTVDFTEKWWWKGTVIITFDPVGSNRTTCVIDYLEQPYSDSVSVLFEPGVGCTGEAGSSSASKDVEAFIYALSGDDVNIIFDNMVTANDAAECVRSISKVLSSKNVINSVWGCGGLAGDAILKINSVLQKYNKQISVP